MPIPAGPDGLSTYGPCSWALNPTCSGWGEYTAEVQGAAIAHATMILWAATGRRFGLCEVTVRPCGAHTTSSLWGYVSDGATWVPYIDYAGTWRSTPACEGGDCAPNSQVWLPGPVAAVVEVVQDGDVVDPSAYQVDDGRWLVRVDGGSWPPAVDLSTNTDRFEVTYLRGTEPPAALLDAAGVLACEFAKARTDQECRLPARMTSLARQGVQVSFLDTDSLTKRGLTGIPEVDRVIVALNPHGLASRPKVISPDMPAPRMRR